MKTLKYEKRQIKEQWGKTPFTRNVAQTGGAVGCRPTGRGFKSHRSDSPPQINNIIKEVGRMDCCENLCQCGSVPNGYSRGWRSIL